MTPRLKTGRLDLRPYTAGMVTPVHIAWLRDKEVVRYSEQRHLPHTLQSQHKYLNEFPANSHIWLIESPLDIFEDWDIGTITAYVDIHNKVADMGILIGVKRFWRQGYGLEAWARVMEFLFDDGIRKIECGCMESNFPMQQLAARSGMIKEGIREGHFMFDGRGNAMFLYGKFK